MNNYQKRAGSPIDEKDRLLIALIKKAAESPEPLEIPAGKGCNTIRIGFYALKKKLARMAEHGEGDPDTLKLMSRLSLTISEGVLTIGDSLHTGGFGSIGEFLGGAEAAIASVRTKDDEEEAARIERLMNISTEASEKVKAYRG